MEQENTGTQPFLHGTKGKVVAAFFLATIAVVVALSISYFGFGELMKNIDTVSTPNEKLQVLNNFFRQVTRLEQEHRAAAIKNPRAASRKILEESKSLVLSLDTLLALSWEEQQMQRLLHIEDVLQKRNRLILRYLRERSLQANNKQYSAQLDSLSRFLMHYTPESDSSVVTTEKKITTTSIPVTREDQKNERSFFARLFGTKKDTDEDERLIEVKEELNIITDTIAISRQDSAIAHIGRIMHTLEETQRSSGQQLIRQELALVNTSTELLYQLIQILHEIESEEINLLQENHRQSVSLFNQSINRMIILIIVFLLGIALLVFFILSDISRSLFYRRQLEKAKEQAEQLRAVKERFLANMSHEIRTPLQSILGFSEQLTGGTNPEAVQAIQHSSEHLLHIVNEVLDYSRIESNKFQLEREPFNLKKLIHEIEVTHRVQTEKKGLDFIVKTSGMKGINLLGDAFRLRQILHNLLGNAIKFTQQGSITLEVLVDDAGYRQECTFKVSDTGIGIHEQDLKRIFDRFEQATNSTAHQFGGTGLGLTIVKALIEAQYGKLDVTSEPGQGTVFTIQLGFDKAPFAASEKETIRIEPAATNFTGKLLVVDDDALILNLCSLILTKHNIEHIIENNPEALLHHELPAGITHVLLDIRMPNINGVELREKLSALFPEQTQFIALTAHALPNEQKRLKEFGFDTILLKPFREEELLNILGVHTANQANYVKHANTRPASFNLSLLEKLTMGDSELLQSVLTQFVADTKKDITELAAHRVDANSALAREVVHKLAGRAGQIGVETLGRALRDIETKLDEGVAVSTLEPVLHEQVAALQELLKEIETISK
ncbi:MAG: response regulator [Cyclobacteriaceae bacterium]|nr:response regulator [Cyclobacteriaceae bacterium]